MKNKFKCTFEHFGQKKYLFTLAGSLLIASNLHAEISMADAIGASNLIPDYESVLQKQKTITGTITDINGESVIGASIIVKGTATGTVTNLEGKFSLSIPENSTIEISYIGYKTKTIKTDKRNEYFIKLAEDTETLDEVVVVGYGTKKKIHLTGAVAAVEGKELIQTPVANLSNSVAGRMPGVIAVNSSGAPGSGSSLSIRGASTLNNNSPLIVVDGVPRDSFDAFDPNEIESITVLKDGAAAAIYGARANNGVFLVTTKEESRKK